MATRRTEKKQLLIHMTPAMLPMSIERECTGIEALEKAEAEANAIALRSRADGGSASLVGSSSRAADLELLTKYMATAAAHAVPLQARLDAASAPTALALSAEHHEAVAALFAELPAGAVRVKLGLGAVERAATLSAEEVISSAAGGNADALESDARLVAAYAAQAEAVHRVRRAMRKLAAQRGVL